MLEGNDKISRLQYLLVGLFGRGVRRTRRISELGAGGWPKDEI